MLESNAIGDHPGPFGKATEALIVGIFKSTEPTSALTSTEVEVWPKGLNIVSGAKPNCK
jgi:hypothetical protein